MKTALKILASSLVAMFFASCSQQAIYYDASGNAVDYSETVSSEGKYVAPVEVAPVVVEAPKKPRKNWFCCKIEEKPKKVKKARVAKAKKPKKQGCTSCLSVYCPKPGCCGTVGKGVFARATMQGGTGEPQLGLIPTMKTLAPDL